jgi:hypothetical protein
MLSDAVKAPMLQAFSIDILIVMSLEVRKFGYLYVKKSVKHRVAQVQVNFSWQEQKNKLTLHARFLKLEV